MYDIIIIGGGPAGLTAALYARRANKSVLVIEKGSFGGQITYSPKVENIPGFLSVTGNEFAEKLVEQVLEQGADVEAAEVLEVRDGDVKTVVTDSGEFEGKTVIIATGARHRLLGLPNEESYVGEGISFCAVCDGAFYEDKTVAVIGGGNSALQEALLLSDLAKKVYVVQNLDFLTGEEKLSEQLYERENVEIILGTVVKALHGEGELTGITVANEKSGEETLLSVDGMFVAIGLVPQNEIFSGILSLDGRGYAVAGEDCITSARGIFAAGDCRVKKIRQVATAAADGAIAALAACDYIDGR
ncbi:MAG: FAD-dependent oxidoreductase [Oscillospiraceae bacterium]|nr:FAD-dependent oxidoreductase [Oscillospiraceae bacterium]MBQ4315790.1 FAD-dependent oxidoreductase [Oscillospiraceae bacterium]MBQ7055159.1 FAD-dependent oxidoreductase [Oscillospiraceae bacterium]